MRSFFKGGLKWVACCLLTGLLAVSAQLQAAPAFDHGVWSQLLQQHVYWTSQGHASVVDYRGMRTDKPRLQTYLTALSAVSRQDFDGWSRDAQLAFLINAYNAFTVQLILTQYPDVKSIKDLGSLFQSPWKKAFVSLLGQTRSLDDIEHGLIRGSGRYRDPRVHFAANCASIGCPALRPEAYLPAQLDAQLDDQTRRFLGDRTRNRLGDGDLIVSPIFKWYREDFGQGFSGDKTLSDFLARYADLLGLSAAQASDLRTGRLVITFDDYDWHLNDDRR